VLNAALYFFVYLPFFLPSEYLCTPSVEENAIQLPFSTPAILQKKQVFLQKEAALPFGKTAFFKLFNFSAN